MIKFEFYTDFSDEQAEILRKYDICLDDWNYALITHNVNEFTEREEEEKIVEMSEDYRPTVKKIKNILIEPIDWNVDNLLGNYNYDKKWHKIMWNGSAAIIGLVYHA